MTLRELLPDLGKRTLVMGILNTTPDSFSDGGRFLDLSEALAHARHLLNDGADIIDIGGESTRPGAAPVSLDQERRRVIPLIERLHAEFPDCVISLDTTKAALAEEGVAAGATLINDISGGTTDPEMLPTVGRLGLPICLMHLPITPDRMSWSKPGGGLASTSDVVGAVVVFLQDQVAAAVRAGVSADNIVIDPGFGFGKSPEQNLAVLKSIREIKSAVDNRPLLIGPSRKSTIARILGDEADGRDPDRVAGTAALVALAAAHGADIVRVHDVEFMARVVKVADAVGQGVRPAPPRPRPSAG